MLKYLNGITILSELIVFLFVVIVGRNFLMFLLLIRRICISYRNRFRFRNKSFFIHDSIHSIFISVLSVFFFFLVYSCCCCYILLFFSLNVFLSLANTHRFIIFFPLCPLRSEIVITYVPAIF